MQEGDSLELNQEIHDRIKKENTYLRIMLRNYIGD